jgi:nucleotide-binding universal stress UspA family protein
MTPDVKKILVPTDFSAPSNSALVFAKALARKFGATLHLIHSLDNPFLTEAYAPEIYVPPPAALREEWIKGAEDLLSTQLTPDEQTVFNSTFDVVFGPAPKAIVEYAAGHGIDLIVMGTHGRGGMAHLVMGSVAERVIRTACCPVLTVRDAGGTRAAQTAAA